MEEDDGCHRELWAQSFDQVGINIKLSDVLEHRGPSYKFLMGYFRASVYDGIQPGSNCKNDGNK